MPSLKASRIAVEAKRTYIPLIEQKCTEWPACTFAHTDIEHLDNLAEENYRPRRLRVAVIDGDAVDVALKWNQEEEWSKTQEPSSTMNSQKLRIPLVLPVNEKRAGGDWEAGSMAPEEIVSRRSNLVLCLSRLTTLSGKPFAYPIPSQGGLYSPHVVLFRSGPKEEYRVWPDFDWLPVISVTPGRRPKLTSSGEDYAFDEEKELMREKNRNVLRIAATWGHRDLCVGLFGIGKDFCNPTRQLAAMWREILFVEGEFQGIFDNVVFAIEHISGGDNANGLADFEIFKEELNPAIIGKISFRNL